MGTVQGYVERLHISNLFQEIQQLLMIIRLNIMCFNCESEGCILLKELILAQFILG